MQCNEERCSAMRGREIQHNTNIIDNREQIKNAIQYQYTSFQYGKYSTANLNTMQHINEAQ